MQKCLAEIGENFLITAAMLEESYYVTSWLWLVPDFHVAQQPESREATRCPVTGSTVPGDSPTWPFADERARMADLYRWMHESYTITREMKDADLEQGEWAHGAFGSAIVSLR